MNNPEAALRGMANEPCFYSTFKERQSDMSQPLWDAVLNGDVAVAQGIVPQEQVEDVTVDPRKNVEACPEERRIGEKLKVFLNQMVVKELRMLVEESLYDILRPMYHNTQNGFRSVLYSLSEHVMLDLLRKDSIGENVNALIAKFSDTDADTDRLSKKFLTSTSSMASRATIVRRKTDSAIAGENTEMAEATKKESMEATEAYGDIIEEPPSQSDTRSEEPHGSRSSRIPSKNPHAKREERHARRH